MTKIKRNAIKHLSACKRTVVGLQFCSPRSLPWCTCCHIDDWAAESHQVPVLCSVSPEGQHGQGRWFNSFCVLSAPGFCAGSYLILCPRCWDSVWAGQLRSHAPMSCLLGLSHGLINQGWWLIWEGNNTILKDKSRNCSSDVWHSLSWHLITMADLKGNKVNPFIRHIWSVSGQV